MCKNSGVFRIWQRGAWRASWNTFCFWMFNGNRKFAHFSKIWKRKRPSNIVGFCNSCWKMTKSAPFHIKSPVKNFHSRAKGGHHTVAPLNTPLCKNHLKWVWSKFLVLERHSWKEIFYMSFVFERHSNFENFLFWLIPAGYVYIPVPCDVRCVKHLHAVTRKTLNNVKCGRN